MKYLETPPSRDELRAILAKLEDEPSKLVRRDNWTELGVTADDARRRMACSTCSVAIRR